MENNLSEEDADDSDNEEEISNRLEPSSSFQEQHRSRMSLPLERSDPNIITDLSFVASEKEVKQLEKRLDDVETDLDKADLDLLNLTNHVSTLNAKVSLLTKKQLLDSDLVQLQQSFVDFSSQIYQLEQYRLNNVNAGKKSSSVGWYRLLFYISAQIQPYTIWFPGEVRI